MGAAAFAGVVVLLLAVGAVVLAITAGRLSHLQGRFDTLSSAQNRLQRSLQSATSALSNARNRVQILEGKVANNIDTAGVARRVLPSVFVIDAGPELGTAFALSHPSSGGTLLITNYHVVRTAIQEGLTTVFLKQNKNEFEARIAATDPGHDLATITTNEQFPLLQRARGTVAAGDPVLALGSPLGLGGSVTSGVVSAVRETGIQFSAPISPGNSGGPVVDRNGKVIGIAEAKIIGNHAENIGIAIPIATVCHSVVAC